MVTNSGKIYFWFLFVYMFSWFFSFQHLVEAWFFVIPSDIDKYLEAIIQAIEQSERQAISLCSTLKYELTLFGLVVIWQKWFMAWIKPMAGKFKMQLMYLNFSRHLPWIIRSISDVTVYADRGKIGLLPLLLLRSKRCPGEALVR